MLGILVVDDERRILDGMRRALDELGLFETFVAQSGLEALAILDEREIDAMLLDIAMPDINGIELMKQLRDRPEKPATVVISGYDEFAFAQEALVFGAVEYLLKPIDSDDVKRIGERLHGLVMAKHREKTQSQKMQQMLGELLADKARGEQPEPPQPSEDNPRHIAERVKRAVEQNYQDVELSVHQLAKMLNYSPNYLGNAFKRAYCLSINDYLAQYRVSEAKRLMDETNLMVYEIAAMVGFDTQNYFSKTFRKYVGMSPSEYRCR